MCLVFPELVLQNERLKDDYFHDVFNLFCEDFISNPLTIGKHRIGIESVPYRRGWHRTFWHLTTEGPIEEDRDPIIERCERIRWPRFMIINAGRLKTWRNTRKGEHRLLIATDDFTYIVVLAIRRGYYYLWSAYCVERESRRKSMEKEYTAYQKNKSKCG